MRYLSFRAFGLGNGTKPERAQNDNPTFTWDRTARRTGFGTVWRLSCIRLHCGADDTVNVAAIYCSSSDVFNIMAPHDAVQVAYLLAHLFGHAAQVQYGVSDIALRTIQAQRDEEPA